MMVFVLAILTLLSMISAVFLTNSAIEKSISHAYSDELRAKMAAQSGVEEAIARLTFIANRGWFQNGDLDTTWMYFGDQLNEKLPPNLSTPLEKAKNPSFAVEQDGNPYSGNNTPRYKTVNGKQLGFTGSVYSTYTEEGDIFISKVLDCQGMINVNDGTEYNILHPVNQNLKRILNILGSQPAIGVPALGDTLVANRPPVGYSSKIEILRALGYDNTKFNKVRDFLTCYSWSNNSVALPVPLDASVLSSYPFGSSYLRPTNGGVKIFRYGHGKNYKGQQIGAPLKFSANPSDNPEFGIYSYDALNPQWIEIARRSPVNINTAPREILIALLKDLQGFFVYERPARAPADIFYRWLPKAYTFDMSRPSEENYSGFDEIGYLNLTLKIDDALAGKIADEIIKCRARSAPYAASNFGGSFKTWAQFDAFADELVKSNVVKDSRNWPLPGDDGGDDSYVPWDGGGPSSNAPSNPQAASAFCRRLASQALADVLKANFNPNLHLNEINPARTIRRLVDKTDLLVNSTEFCFVPMGTFEIESIGLVLKPKGAAAGTTAGPADDLEIIAQKKINTVVQVYDAYHESTFDKFYKGDFGARTKGPTTSTNRAVEAGPEADNGNLPEDETGYEGYITLTTNLGSFNGNSTKAKNQLVQTSSGCTTNFGSTFHSHFQFDHKAHSASGMVQVDQNNYADKSETVASPYSPVTGSKYRVCRSFKVAQNNTAPNGYYYSPSDLRIDGAYMETHSAIGYVIDKGQYKDGFVVSFWMKPNFYPEGTARIKTLVSSNTYQNHSDTYGMMPLTAYFLPSHGPLHDPSSTSYGGPGRRCSILCANAFPAEIISPGGGVGHASPTLNHEFESPSEDFNRLVGSDGKVNVMRGWEWMHVTIQYKTQGFEIYVNGKVLPATTEIVVHEKPPSDWIATLMDQTLRIGGELAKKASESLNGIPRRMYFADCTLDEVYVWDSPGQSAGINNSINIFTLGRHYKPTDSNENDGTFTSALIDLFKGTRKPAPMANSTPPGGETSAASASTSLKSNLEIIGASWTVLAEDYDTSTEPGGNSRMKPVMYDWYQWYSTGGIPAKLTPQNLNDVNGYPSETCADMYFLLPAGVKVGPFRQEGFSPVNAVIQQTSQTSSPSDNAFQYKVKFRIGAATNATILLASPIVDDVTIFYRHGTSYRSYYYVNVAEGF